MSGLSGNTKSPQQFPTGTIANDDYILFGKGSIQKIAFQNLKNNIIKQGAATGNINNLTDNGLYWCDFGNITSTPYGDAEYGWILVLNSGVASRIQVIFKHSVSGISEISMRGYTNSTWYPWRKIATEAI